jgi:hypothetical protein
MIISVIFDRYSKSDRHKYGCGYSLFAIAYMVAANIFIIQSNFDPLLSVHLSKNIGFVLYAGQSDCKMNDG